MELTDNSQIYTGSYQSAPQREDTGARVRSLKAGVGQRPSEQMTLLLESLQWVEPARKALQGSHPG
jgi:hypothetical protein